MKINLVKGGIFPIKSQLDNDSTGLSVSGTYQGEGKLLGTSCLFIRTSGCNLRCAWIDLKGNGSLCDTPYSSHEAETNIMLVDDIISIVKDNTLSQNIKHVVISGGEPTLQFLPLAHLLELLKNEGYHTTLETNGTIFKENISRSTDLVSLSPKLSTSTPLLPNLKNTGIRFNEKWALKHEQDRINIDVLQNYINGKKKYNNDFQLKFVVSSQEDIEEIDNILSKLYDFEPNDVILMPEGVDNDTLNKRTSLLIGEGLKRGWRFSPRLHVQLFGKNRFV